MNKPVEESQRNGHAEVNSFQNTRTNSHQNKSNNRRGGHNGGGSGGSSAGHARTEEYEDQTNLPPRLRSKDENNVGVGGRSDQGNRNNRNHKNRRTSPNNFNSSKVGDGGRNSSARKNSPNSNRQPQQTVTTGANYWTFFFVTLT